VLGGMGGSLLPDGVARVPIAAHVDERGSLRELFRASWGTGVAPVQWNLARSAAGVMRGVHCHLHHADYLMVVDGTLFLGLHDLRPGSATEGASALVPLEATDVAVVIPPGVAHGFYFPEPTTHLYAVTREFDPADELGCTWRDHELAIEWPCDAPILSPRDAAAGSLSELRHAVRAAAAAS
jgi:dTDP-4-dehydrorhamnose 3,5-epimerase